MTCSAPESTFSDEVPQGVVERRFPSTTWRVNLNLIVHLIERKRALRKALFFIFIDKSEVIVLMYCDDRVRPLKLLLNQLQ